MASGVGPWANPDRDPDYVKGTTWNAGDVLEFVCHDDDGKSQGTAILIILGTGGKVRLHEAAYIQGSDYYYE